MNTWQKMALVCALLGGLTMYGMAAEGQKIVRAGEQASYAGPGELFTGNVRVDPVFSEMPGISAIAGTVTFEPGARSNWHFHPAGQHIIVLSGVGRTGTRDGKVEEFRAGDVVSCPANVHHWHGAAPQVGMTHLTITGQVNGKNTEWLEPVTDEQYGRQE